jgi:hypothetical protein
VTLAQLAGALPITYRQAYHWASKGLLPGVEVEPGTGNPRVLTRRQTDHFRLMANLVASGVSPAAASGYATQLLDDGSVHLPGGITLQVTS